jgi:hypothetical protein
MPSFSEHLNQAKRNKEFLGEIPADVKTRYPEWVIIVHFYTAVHYIEAILDKLHNAHSKDHQDRFKLIMRFSSFTKDFQLNYDELYNFSIIARYLSKGTQTITTTEARQAEASFKFIENFTRRFFKL